MVGHRVVTLAVLSAALLLSTAKAELLVPCNYTEVQGPYCLDCHTRAICTPLGGIPIFTCWIPSLQNCVNGHCAPQPSPECAQKPTSTTPAPTTESPTTEEPATEYFNFSNDS